MAHKARHPRRTQGNPTTNPVCRSPEATSPRTQGDQQRRRYQDKGDIPAHAGGNQASCTGTLQTDATSPRTRGQPHIGNLRDGVVGDIPAHAGTTRPGNTVQNGKQRHPHAREEPAWMERRCMI